jgi:hypothetical protein
MPKFDLSQYETVEQRLVRLYAAHPDSRVITDMVYRDERSFIVKAYIYLTKEDQSNLLPAATGYAEEIVGASNVNQTSALENGETSAIGRAIANSLLGTENGKRASSSEMGKVNRYDDEPRKMPTKVRTFTPEQLDHLGKLLAMIADENDIDTLRRYWDEEKDFLDVQINGTTLKDALNLRAFQLATPKDADKLANTWEGK